MKLKKIIFCLFALSFSCFLFYSPVIAEADTTSVGFGYAEESTDTVVDNGTSDIEDTFPSLGTTLSNGFIILGFLLLFMCYFFKTSSRKEIENENE